MPSVLLDATPFTLRQDMKTWADLLAAIDRDLDVRGRVVTDVRFGGVDEPSYREPSSLTRRLADRGRVEIVTATPDELVRSCLRDAAASVRALTGETARAADLFRTQQRVSTAHERLAVVASELAQLMALVQTLQGPLGLSLAPTPAEAAAQRHDLETFTGLLEGLLEAQRAGDHYAVADILEYDLAPFLHRWQARFDALAA